MSEPHTDMEGTPAPRENLSAERVIELYKEGRRDFSGLDLSFRSFGEAVLPGIDLSDTNLQNSSFRGAYLRRADFTEAWTIGADFSFADLREADFTDSGANALDGAQCEGARFFGCHLCDTTVAGATFAGATFRGATIEGVSFDGHDLSGIDFSRGHIVNTRFTRANLHKAKFHDTRIIQCGFDDADMGLANMRGSSLEDCALTPGQIDQLAEGPEVVRTGQDSRLPEPPPEQ